MSKDSWDDAPEINAQSSETWDEKGGEPIIGTYLGFKADVGPNNSKMFNIKRTTDGEIVGVWGATVLDDKMAAVDVGNLVRIEFLGKKANVKTGKEYKDYSVKQKPSDGSTPNVPAPETTIEQDIEEGEKLELAEIPFDDPKKA